MNSGLRPGLTPTGLALKQLALLLIINEKVSNDERGKESRVALELDDLDCSDGHTLLVDLTLGATKFPWPILVPFLFVGFLLYSNNVLSKVIGEPVANAAPGTASKN